MLLQCRVEKTVYGVETHWQTGKEKDPGSAVNKERHDVSLLGHHRIHVYRSKKVQLYTKLLIAYCLGNISVNSLSGPRFVYPPR